jgi:glycosyltransferase involved in cell wall biosynthesis
MKKIRVNYIFRKRGIGHNSIEELFQSIIAKLPVEVEPIIVELPYSGASPKSIMLNIWHVLFLKGIIHVTGDVYYIGLIPFKKTILTIHDIHFISGSFMKKLFLKLFWLVLPAFFAKRITLISEFSTRELLKITPWAKKKVRVIYNPVNTILETKEKEFSRPPKILHLGTKLNKNLINTIKGLSDIECVFIILGALTKKQQNALIEYNIDFVNYVGLPFLKIKELYESSDIVSFISLYEGFGMPIIEAQKVGRVVITSREASLPEVAGSGAYFVDTKNIDEIENGFNRLIQDKDLRISLIQNGFENVERFNMAAINQQYVDLYIELN